MLLKIAVQEHMVCVDCSGQELEQTLDFFSVKHKIHVWSYCGLRDGEKPDGIAAMVSPKFQRHTLCVN